MKRIRKVAFLLILSILSYNISTVCMKSQQNSIDEKQKKLNKELLSECWNSWNSKLEKVKKLVEAGADIDCQDRYKETPLHRASSRGNKKIVKYLVSKGANLNLRDDDGNNSFDKAVIWLHVDLAEHLENNGATLDVNKVYTESKDTILHFASYLSHVGYVRHLVEDKKANINRRNKHGSTPLHIACRQGKLEIVKYLIQKGGKLDIKDNEGRTPLESLLYRLRYDNFKVIEYLDSLGIVDVDQKHSDCNKGDIKETVLHKAIRLEKMDYVKHLVENRKADVNSVDKKLNTPLHVAADRGFFEIVKYLVEQGAEINAKNKHDSTPLLTALDSCYPISLKIARYLESKGADFDVNFEVEADCDLYENLLSALHIAAHYGLLDDCKYLVEEKKANVNLNGIQTEVFSAPLHEAAKEGKLKVVKYLVESANANIDIENKSKETPLQVACKERRYSVAKYLLKRKAKIKQSKKEKTKLIICSCDLLNKLEDIIYQDTTHLVSPETVIGDLILNIENKKCEKKFKNFILKHLLKLKMHNKYPKLLTKEFIKKQFWIWSLKKKDFEDKRLLSAIIGLVDQSSVEEFEQNLLRMLSYEEEVVHQFFSNDWPITSTPGLLDKILTKTINDYDFASPIVRLLYLTLEISGRENKKFLNNFENNYTVYRYLESLTCTDIASYIMGFCRYCDTKKDAVNFAAALSKRIRKKKY